MNKGLLELIDATTKEDLKKGQDGLAFPGTIGAVVSHSNETGENDYVPILAKGLTKLEWMKGQVAAGLMANSKVQGDMGVIAWEIHLMAELLLNPEQAKKDWEAAQLKKADASKERTSDDLPF